MKKFCTKCGREFEAVGREVICPACKATAAEAAKKAAVLKAKRASWTGESVPVRISGRASTIIREFGASRTMTFAESLDALLMSSCFFESMGIKWKDVEPYRSRRRDKHATETTQDAQDATETVQDAQDAPQASKTTSKTSTAKASKTASKSSSKSSKASKSISTK